MSKCKECEYIEVLLSTCRAADQAVYTVMKHLKELHEIEEIHTLENNAT